jgi:hypothetical protein
MVKQKVHFLHIGKTGGTAIKYALKDCLKKGKYDIILHEHNYTLKNVPVGDKVFFFVRDPISRFVSGFYSRQRQGRPKYNVPWSKEEEKAFLYFDTPNSLAKNIYTLNLFKRKIARNAMQNIAHVNTSYWDWFIEPEYFKSRVDDILFVGQQKRLNEDFEILKEKLEIGDVVLPQNNILMHKNPVNMDKRLSDKAVKNLRKWYNNEYEFLNVCIDNDLIHGE